MNLLFDTNIILALARDKSKENLLKFVNPQNALIYVSFVNVAETQSIAFQNDWGFDKMQIIESFFNSVRVISISDLLLNSYIEIEAFSQRSHPEIKDYEFKTPRNMGKNDLWIAATASLLNLRLVTTDKDFSHLNPKFISLQKISTSSISEIMKR